MNPLAALSVDDDDADGATTLRPTPATLDADAAPTALASRPVIQSPSQPILLDGSGLFPASQAVARRATALRQLSSTLTQTTPSAARRSASTTLKPLNNARTCAVDATRPEQTSAPPHNGRGSAETLPIPSSTLSPGIGSPPQEAPGSSGDGDYDYHPAANGAGSLVTSDAPQPPPPVPAKPRL
jgi:hypothetical protein